MISVPSATALRSNNWCQQTEPIVITVEQDRTPRRAAPGCVDHLSRLFDDRILPSGDELSGNDWAIKMFAKAVTSMMAMPPAITASRHPINS
jgi:hypothetical protein